MAEIEISTVLISIQAVKKQAEYFQGLLNSDNGIDNSEVEELLITFDQAAENLKGVYNSMRSKSKHYPKYEEILG